MMNTGDIHYDAKQRHYKAKSSCIHKPVLSSIEQMMVDNYYIEAIEKEKTTGVAYEVDHIIPRTLGGPHAPWNLQVLTAQENKSKGDKLWQSATAN